MSVLLAVTVSTLDCKCQHCWLYMSALLATMSQDQYAGMETVFRKTLFLLRLLIRENHKVQDKIFDNLDKLLDVQIVRSDLALALKEVSQV